MKKYFVFLLVLFSCTLIVHAENIPLPEETLQQIGYDNIRLENGIGVIVFNMSQQTDMFHADGYLTVSNTFDAPVTMSCNLITQLSPVDLDTDGNPRLHKKISDTILFEPFPSIDWISLESNNINVDPLSSYNFHYNINIPCDSFDFKEKQGFLCYINVKKEIQDPEGVNIGIDYNYKIFLVFTGFQQQNLISVPPVLLYTGCLIFGVGATGCYVGWWNWKKNKQDKSSNQIKNISSVQEFTPESRDVHQDIDHLIQSKYY